MRNKQKQQQLQMSTNFADSLPCGVWYLVFSTLVTVCSVRPNTFDIATVGVKIYLSNQPSQYVYYSFKIKN